MFPRVSDQPSLRSYLILAAKRREVSGRVERELREERTAQWMATLRGPGWARRGRCHMEI